MAKGHASDKLDAISKIPGTCKVYKIRNPPSVYAQHILNRHEYGPTDNTMSLLKHIRNTMLLPYEQLYICNVHRILEISRQRMVKMMKYV